MWNSFPILLVNLAILSIPLTHNVTYILFLAYSDVAVNAGIASV